jgi:hypothetical protein
MRARPARICLVTSSNPGPQLGRVLDPSILCRVPSSFVKDGIHDATKKIKDVAHNVGRKVGDAAHNVGEKVGDAGR